MFFLQHLKCYGYACSYTKLTSYIYKSVTIDVPWMRICLLSLKIWNSYFIVSGLCSIPSRTAGKDSVSVYHMLHNQFAVNTEFSPIIAIINIVGTRGLSNMKITSVKFYHCFSLFFSCLTENCKSES